MVDGWVVAVLHEGECLWMDGCLLVNDAWIWFVTKAHDSFQVVITSINCGINILNAQTPAGCTAIDDQYHL